MDRPPMALRPTVQAPMKHQVMRLQPRREKTVRVEEEVLEIGFYWVNGRNFKDTTGHLLKAPLKCLWTSDKKLGTRKEKEIIIV